MPSLLPLNDAVPCETPKDKSTKKKDKGKKSKSPNGAVWEPESLSPKNKSKKRKKSFDEEEQQKSETSSELVEPTEEEALKSELNSNNKKRNKKTKLAEEEEVSKEEDSNAVSKFRISEPLRVKLKEKGIETLFPIQAMTFDTILDGSDLVGRARTGQGKTLAFVLPILESLTNGPAKAARKTGYGRPPSVLVLLPTRELASQVHTDFEVYGSAMGLTSCCLYGGTPYHTQDIKLKRGVDIVIGTPGRVKDHIERENLYLGHLRFRVLDEADEMLRMGFVEDVELILGKVEDVGKVQTLLFSATLPNWVKHISAKFLKPDKKTADLVGNEKMKASTNVRHFVLPCHSSTMSQIIPDIIRFYSSGGRTIVFTEKKETASEFAGLLPGARALHGDIPQSQREVTLAAFRSGKFMTLVATNVAARGLDINDVQLIIQCEPPRDVEAYIHRSGRTGRAGNTGVAVMLYDPRKGSKIGQIERESGVKFERITTPQPDDIAKAAGVEAAAGVINQVSDSVIPAFKPAAEELLNNSGLSAVELLAKALAKAAGFTEVKKRSILTSREDYVTLLLQIGRPMFSPMFALGVLKRFLPEEKVESVQGLSFTADGNGAVFDIPAKDSDLFLNGSQNSAGVSLELVTTLPPLKERDPPRGARFGGGRGFNDRSGGNRFSCGRGGGFSSQSNRFSNGFKGGRGNGNRGRYGGQRSFRDF
ncbi:DEAD-box ATP-dependent RNA helicase 7-like [Abrus precatorius]|uniref:RNA helicase n=1 Tax=Abrus precatorius TaxID=3816 RepID=A0A8B8LNM9_ABRPR|nr:DEAD-box ATP-dependent RNA helicase 7-like [Abrus precatorius]XP_027357871.1 DEAD-box ATP-dependent RNA helicase 7-like [Abrus precatorius]